MHTKWMADWMSWVFVISILASTPRLQAESDDNSLLCISKCDTCPKICSPAPPPPPPPSPPPLSLPPPPDDSSFLCISKCGTCPVICTPPPPPSSPPPAIYVWTSHPPPSPAKEGHAPQPKSAPPPPEGGQKGGLSYPYYYFYTSGAKRLCVLPRLLLTFLTVVMSMFLWVFLG
ncbi:leucine-rich repeat extensin-like protein 3 [Zingiber officinale]|uniref:leucine-rich repeat extensin-like protein 3 n=1 Tax=Zingiber officinale TaxID=94328 RepID=UPI001C4B9188|nr:leucine-rich repeat extensin-like protein 3 [Zingiber officinale]